MIRGNRCQFFRKHSRSRSNSRDRSHDHPSSTPNRPAVPATADANNSTAQQQPWMSRSRSTSQERPLNLGQTTGLSHIIQPPSLPGTCGIQLELNISCKNLRPKSHFSHINPVCTVYVKSRRILNWKELGRTERMKHTKNPEWAHSIDMIYFFERQQVLCLAVNSWDNKEGDETFQQYHLGTATCTVAELLRAPGLKLEMALTPEKHTPGDMGYITICAEEKPGIRDKIKFVGSNLEKKDSFSESDPFFSIYRAKAHGGEKLVYRSEYIKNKRDPEWQPVETTSAKLCKGDWGRELKVKVYDYDSSGEHDFIGEFSTSLDEMSEGEGYQIVQWDVINQAQKDKSKKEGKKYNYYKNSGQVILKSMEIQQDTTFLDFIRGGLRMHLIVAVDFSKSNKDPNSPESLHYYHAKENPYSAAIKAIGDVFEDYNYGYGSEMKSMEQEAIAESMMSRGSQLIGLGFSGIVNGKTSQCFPLNRTPRRPLVRGVDGLLRAYYKSLESVSLSDPTCFSGVIDYVRQMAEDLRPRNNDYCVLLIITDGGIEDLDETSRLIVENAHLPMSIIIVGVGSVQDSDAKMMELLDDDDRCQLTYQGRRPRRDIVQYVEMERYVKGLETMEDFPGLVDNSNAKYYLAKDVLAEIPEQVCTYMQRNGIKPQPPIAEED